VNLTQAIAAAGMTPPREIVPGRWLRFPGIGKGRSNRAGWCRVISPTLAIFGDWSTGLTETWRDDGHRDDERTRRLLAEARQRERVFAAEQLKRQREAADIAERYIDEAALSTHPYLARKGFPDLVGLVHSQKLLVPVRDSNGHVISAQLIAENGEKRFLPGGRTRGGIHRLGVLPFKARKTVLCEGYATGLSLDAALHRLPGPHAVIVCFSARNLELVAETFPHAVIAADNDRSATGEETAKRTGLKWTMPYEVASDFNDVHQNMGLHVVVERMREVFALDSGGDVTARPRR
jgi:putative DNA primase/helicase